MTPRIAGFTLGLLLAAAGACLVANPLHATQEDAAAPSPQARPSISQAAPAPAPPALLGPASFAPLVRRVKGAVVNISVRAPVRRRTIFDRPRIEEGQGSGFLVQADGLVLTNLHVVLPAILHPEGGRILVGLADGRGLPAAAIAYQEQTDLALLDLEGEGYPWVPLGDSSRVEPGDWIVAIGNPLGLGHTVTAGIVSATGRPLHISDRRFAGLEVENDFYLQVDTPINPGNSGGPLFDTKGEVVGIATSIIQGAEGIGFAIPSRIARRFLDEYRRMPAEELAQGPKGFLGIRFRVLSSRQDAWLYGVDPPEGARVEEVLPGTPAAAAGLRPGDVILRFGDMRVGQDREGFLRRIWGTAPGTKVELEVFRAGRRLRVSIVVGDDREKNPL